jgi:hypothetical protein
MAMITASVIFSRLRKSMPEVNDGPSPDVDIFAFGKSKFHHEFLAAALQSSLPLVFVFLFGLS